MLKFKRSRTYEEVIQQCKAQGVPYDDFLFRTQGHDHIVVGCTRQHIYRAGQGYVLLNTFNGRFFGKTDKGVEFNSNSAKHDGEPWMQALLHFFNTNDPMPAAKKVKG